MGEIQGYLLPELLPGSPLSLCFPLSFLFFNLLCHRFTHSQLCFRGASVSYTCLSEPNLLSTGYIISKPWERQSSQGPPLFQSPVVPVVGLPYCMWYSLAYIGFLPKGIGQEKITGDFNVRRWLFWKYNNNGNTIQRMISNSMKGTCDEVMSICASEEMESKFSTSNSKLICPKY